MSQIYTTGPVQAWVAFKGTAGPTFLGYSEKGPSFQVRPQYSNVFTDYGGQDVPFDVIYQGKDAIVSCDLIDLNIGLLYAIQDIAGLSGAPGDAGTDDPGEIGTLMITEGKAYQLYLYYPYANKAAFSTMEPGQRFMAAMLMNDDSPSLGTKEKKQHLVWHCLRAPDFSQPDNLGPVKLKLFDFDMAGVSSGAIR